MTNTTKTPNPMTLLRRLALTAAVFTVLASACASNDGDQLTVPTTTTPSTTTIADTATPTTETPTLQVELDTPTDEVGAVDTAEETDTSDTQGDPEVDAGAEPEPVEVDIPKTITEVDVDDPEVGIDATVEPTSTTSIPADTANAPETDMGDGAAPSDEPMSTAERILAIPKDSETGYPTRRNPLWDSRVDLGDLTIIGACPNPPGPNTELWVLVEEYIGYIDDTDSGCRPKDCGSLSWQGHIDNGYCFSLWEEMKALAGRDCPQVDTSDGRGFVGAYRTQLIRLADGSIIHDQVDPRWSDPSGETILGPKMPFMTPGTSWKVEVRYSDNKHFGPIPPESVPDADSFKVFPLATFVGGDTWVPIDEWILVLVEDDTGEGYFERTWTMPPGELSEPAVLSVEANFLGCWAVRFTEL